MKTFVLVEDGVVVSRHIAANVEQLRSELPVGSDIREGNAWVGYTAEPDGSFTPPAPPPVTRDDLKADLASYRWEVETGGVDVTLSTGTKHRVHTSREGQATLDTLFAAIKNGLRQSGAVFKFADGSFVAVSNEDMQTVIVAALDHVQACFEAEALVTDQIENGALSTHAELKPAFDLALQAVKALPA